MINIQYEPTKAARPVSVEHHGDMTRVIVPMVGPYVPVPAWTGYFDVLSVVLVPLWWVVTFLVRTCLNRRTPPRALFEVSKKRFRMVLRDQATGEKLAHTWSTPAVMEVRRNRFGNGLWIHVAGEIKETFLTDLSPDTLERLEVAIGEAVAAHTVKPKSAEA